MHFQLARWNLWGSPSLFQRQWPIWDSISLLAHLGSLIKDIKYTEILAKHVLIRINLLLYASNFLLQPAIPLIILSRIGWSSSLFNFSKCKGIPRYLMGKELNLRYVRSHRWPPLPYSWGLSHFLGSLSSCRDSFKKHQGALKIPNWHWVTRGK
jgi:hypothetical protein